MEAEEINHACKRSRIGGSSAPAAKIGRLEHHPSSRIFRVSRASGGKDRHSKVYTAKGLRDRRVRLSVSTAIQFYDLQDRLGYDQPSKAIEWLIKAADAAIAELPTLESAFPQLLPKPDEKAPGMGQEVDPGDEMQLQQQHLSMTKSGCSSTSDTSKGSVLSLARSEIRIKARERARERAAKDKEKDEDEGGHVAAAANHQAINSQASFTELLTGNNSNGAQMNSTAKPIRYMPAVTATADYFTQAGFFGQSQKPQQLQHNYSPIGMVPFNIAAAAAAAAASDHPEMQQFSFLQDHQIPIAAVGAAGDYNFNFSISPGLAGLSRGTLQSNSPSHLSYHHHLQRLPSPADRSNLPFFFGAPAQATSAAAENQFPSGLQLCYGDGFRHSDLKGKEKS